jgi:hypothetical protein
MCGCTAPEDRGSIIAARTSLLATRRPAAQLLALTRDQVDCSAEQRLQDNDRFAKERPATQLRGRPVPLDEAANVVAGPSRPRRGDVRPIWELPWLAFLFGVGRFLGAGLVLPFFPRFRPASLGIVTGRIGGLRRRGSWVMPLTHRTLAQTCRCHPVRFMRVATDLEPHTSDRERR